MLSEKEKQYITHIAYLIKDGKSIPVTPINRIEGRSLSDLFETGKIYRSILN